MHGQVLPLARCSASTHKRLTPNVYSSFIAPKKPACATKYRGISMIGATQLTGATRNALLVQHLYHLARVYLRTISSFPATIHISSLTLLTPKLHSRDMADIATAEYLLAILKGTHRPALPLTKRWPLENIRNLRPNGVHEPLDNRRVKWLVERELLDAFCTLSEQGLPIPSTKLGHESWPIRRTLGHGNGSKVRAYVDIFCQ